MGGRARADKRRVAVDNFPEDFQVLLNDYLEHGGVVVVRDAYLPDYRRQLDMAKTNWQEDDFARADEYRQDMFRGDTFPPLLISRGRVLDGYHRLEALRMLRRRTFWSIFLEDQPAEAAAQILENC